MKTGAISDFVKAVQPIVFCALLLAFLAGCAGKTAGPVGPIFFPPPPDEPHVQYLMGINDSTDIEGKPAQFSLFLTGSDQGGLIKKIGKPYGLVAKNGKLYVCSIGGGQVIVIDFAKNTFNFLKGNVRGAGELKRPINATVDNEGNLFVIDGAKRAILVYDAEGNYLRSFRADFGTDEEKSLIVGIAAYDNLLYVLDSKSNLIRVLDRMSGEQLRSFGYDPENKIGLTIPSNISIDDKGAIYVTNLGKSNVTVFDRDGHFLYKFGQVSDRLGGFSRPKGIAVDKDGWIYVADAAFSNVQVFNADAKRMLGFFGTPGLPAGSLNLPAGIAVTTDNLPYFQKLAAPGFILDKVVFVANQSLTEINSFISVYGVGEMEGSKKKEAAKSNDPAK